MEENGALGADRRQHLLDLYDDALPQVYGYLVRRCASGVLAEDLTAETFLAALDSCACGTTTTPTIAWLVTVARNKLVDHWRRSMREQRKLALIASDPLPEPEAWDAELDEARVRATVRDSDPTIRPRHAPIPRPAAGPHRRRVPRSHRARDRSVADAGQGRVPPDL